MRQFRKYIVCLEQILGMKEISRVLAIKRANFFDIFMHDNAQMLPVMKVVQVFYRFRLLACSLENSAVINAHVQELPVDNILVH